MLDVFPTLAKDKKQAYLWNGHVIEGIDGSELRKLSKVYATDGIKVLYRGKIIPEADARTFKVNSLQTKTEKASDKNYRYQYGKVVGSVVVW